ncbi:MAG: type toxin-antitoxin system RelE/ParE family toxin [Streptomyces oryziradicis]|jgi:mRNA interferase RelE/StbE|nr:type toxin-antitoxin system RelE/ParE family toxin [Actinacidiphila oryziradicis]
MTLTLIWAPRATQQFGTLRQADHPGAKGCAAAVRCLVDEPAPPDAVPIGGSGYYRLHAGDWRVMYRLMEAEGALHVLTVGRVRS